MKELIENYIKDLTNTINKIDRNEIETIIKLFEKVVEDKKSIYVMGNGGSASTASHFACEIAKSVSMAKNEQIKMISLNDNMTMLTAYSNDVSYDDVFCEQLKIILNEGDIVIGLSGSGNSKNVLKAIDYANKKGATTIGFTGYKGGKLKDLCKYSLNANIDDMQISEEIHLMMVHLCMRALLK